MTAEHSPKAKSEPAPRTAAGRALLEREAYNSRSFSIVRLQDILAIEAEAHHLGNAAAVRLVAGQPPPDIDIPRLAEALQRSEFNLRPHPSDAMKMARSIAKAYKR